MTREPLPPTLPQPDERPRTSDPAAVEVKRPWGGNVDTTLRSLLPPDVRWMVGAYGE